MVTRTWFPRALQRHLPCIPRDAERVYTAAHTFVEPSRDYSVCITMQGAVFREYAAVPGVPVAHLYGGAGVILWQRRGLTYARRLWPWERATFEEVA